MSTPLSEVLNPSPAPKVEPKPVKAEPVATKEPEPSPEKETKGEPATPPVAKEPTPKPEPVETDEVRGLKRALAETRAKLREQEKPEHPKAPEFFENPEGFVQHQTNDLRAAIGQTRVEMSQEFMRELHPDYDAMEAAFIELAKENPILESRLLQAKNPAKFAYDTAKKAKALAEMGDPEAMKAKLRAEVEKEVRAKVEAELAEEAKKRAAIQPSLAAVPGVAGATKPAPGSFHTPLSTILKEGK